MGKKKLTPNQQLFSQELIRIKRFINKKQKAGYHFNFDLPTMPSRVTQKALRDIKAITPLQLYSNAEVADQETGEIIKAIEYQAQKRSEASKKGWETRKSNPDYKKPFKVDFSLKEDSQNKVKDIVYVKMIYSVKITDSQNKVIGGSSDIPITFTVKIMGNDWYITEKEEPA